MAVGTSLSEIAKGVFAKLNGDSVLASLGVTGVFDVGDVPEGTTFRDSNGNPTRYITMGDNTTEATDDTMSSNNYDATFTLGLWSQDTGYKQLYAVLGRCNRLLHRQPLTLDTLQHAGLWYLTTAEMPPDPTDGITLRLVPRYRIYTTEGL